MELEISDLLQLARDNAYPLCFFGLLLLYMVGGRARYNQDYSGTGDFREFADLEGDGDGD